MNFYKYFIEEESFDYYDLYKIGEENFNSWFKENSIHFTINTKKEILPSDELLIELTNKSYCPKKVNVIIIPNWHVYFMMNWFYVLDY